MLTLISFQISMLNLVLISLRYHFSEISHPLPCYHCQMWLIIGVIITVILVIILGAAYSTIKRTIS